MGASTQCRDRRKRNRSKGRVTLAVPSVQMPHCAQELRLVGLTSILAYCPLGFIFLVEPAPDVGNVYSLAGAEANALLCKFKRARAFQVHGA